MKNTGRAGADYTVRVWDAGTGTALATLAGHSYVVSTATFSPDGTRVLTGSWDGTARIRQLDASVPAPTKRP
jgi:WD40 repeat protein